MQTLGVVAGGDKQRGRGVDADAIDGEQLGGSLFEQRRDHGVEVGDLLFEVAERCASDQSAALVAAVTTSGERVGRSPWAAATKAAIGRPLSLLWSWSGALKVSWRIWVSALMPRPVGRALGDDEDPDGLDTAVSTLRRSMGSAGLGRPGRLERVEGIGLAALAPGLAVLAVHLDDVDSCFGKEAGDARPIGPCPLHPDLSDATEGLKPAEQGRVPVGSAPKDFGAEQAPDVVEGGGHIDLAVSVDATGDSARGFYDGHAIPSFP